MHCCSQCPWPLSRALSTHASARDSWTLMGKSGSASCGVTAPFSWVLVLTRFCLCPPRACFPCVSSSGSMVGLMATSSKRADAIPRCAAPRAPAPVAAHRWTVPLQETFKHSSGSVSVGSRGPGVHKVWALWVCLVGKGFDSNCDFSLPTTLLEFLLRPWTWGIFFGGVQHSPIDGFSAASCSFGVLAREDKCMSFCSAILHHSPQD